MTVPGYTAGRLAVHYTPRAVRLPAGIPYELLSPLLWAWTLDVRLLPCGRCAAATRQHGPGGGRAWDFPPFEGLSGLPTAFRPFANGRYRVARPC